MNKRTFLWLLGGAAAWSLGARAQQAALPVIGLVRSTASADSAHIVRAFRQGLSKAGFDEGRNCAIEYRWANNQLDRLPALLADLLRRPVDVIVANTPAALAAKAMTQTVPIVFAGGGDPVRDGLVPSLSRPDANITGVHFFFSELGAKRLDLLRQMAPSASTIAVLVNPNHGDTEAERTDVVATGKAIGQRLLVLDVNSEPDIERAFATAIEHGAGALYVGTGAFTNSYRDRLVGLAARHGLPASYSQREAVVGGGLMSYGPSITDAYRQTGIYVGRILKGEKPADLPIMRSTTFELMLNLKTARALGLEIPDKLLALADEVVE
jgi:putative tryptophan/tyrosine transport system substrate-binding protein